MPEIAEASSMALLDGAELPVGTPPEYQAVRRALAALRAEPASEELTGEAAVLAAFRDLAADNWATVSHVGPERANGLRPPHLARHRRVSAASGRPGFTRPFLVAAAVIAVLVIGGLAGAYAGMLPAPIQRAAHDLIGAPGPSPNGRPSIGASRTAVTLCAAWAHAKAQGDTQAEAAAFAKLAKAAGGADRVVLYCANAASQSGFPGASPHASGTPTPHPSPRGTEPTPHPSPSDTSPEHSPSPHPSHTHPTPHGSHSPRGQS